MEEMKSIFLVKTTSYRCYVVANNPNEAWEKFKNWLEDGDGYGFRDDRILESIEVVASESTLYPKSPCGITMNDKGNDKLII